jgi:hypothetical protein
VDDPVLYASAVGWEKLEARAVNFREPYL